jgi:hypothetical protein
MVFGADRHECDPRCVGREDFMVLICELVALCARVVALRNVNGTRARMGWRRTVGAAAESETRAEQLESNNEQKNKITLNRKELPHLQCLGRILGDFQQFARRGRPRLGTGGERGYGSLCADGREKWRETCGRGSRRIGDPCRAEIGMLGRQPPIPSLRSPPPLLPPLLLECQHARGAQTPLVSI